MIAGYRDDSMLFPDLLGEPVKRTRPSIWPWVLIFFAALVGICMGRYAEPTEFCMADSPPLVFGPYPCAAQPANKRAFYPDTLTWRGQEYLIVSDGNALQIRSISNPLIPTVVSTGSFGVGNNGDSDYDLLTYAVCDDCRWGVAVFQLATVLFDLGEEDKPEFVDFHKSEEIGEVPPLFTFAWDGHQYLIAAGINEYECGPQSSGLYLFDAIDPAKLTLLQCQTGLDGEEALMTSGEFLQDDARNSGQPHLWVTNGYRLSIYSVSGSGASLSLTFVREIMDTPTVGRGAPIKGFGVDLDAGIAVTTYPTAGIKTWNIDDLSEPYVVGQLAAPEGYTITSLAYPMAWFGAYNTPGMETTVSLVDHTAPEMIHDNFWYAGQPWNQHPCATSQTGSVFTASGDYLFAGRYEVLQRFNFLQCDLEPPDPTHIFSDGLESGDVSEWAL